MALKQRSTDTNLSQTKIPLFSRKEKIWRGQNSKKSSGLLFKEISKTIFSPIVTLVRSEGAVVSAVSFFWFPSSCQWLSNLASCSCVSTVDIYYAGPFCGLKWIARAWSSSVLGSSIRRSKVVSVISEVRGLEASMFETGQSLHMHTLLLFHFKMCLLLGPEVLLLRIWDKYLGAHPPDSC